MYLEILRSSTESRIHENPLSRLSIWSYELTSGNYTYRFSGSAQEKKEFEAFKNVSKYRNALSAMLDYLNTELQKMAAQVDTQVLIINHNFNETCKHIIDSLSEAMPKLKGKLSHTQKLQEVANFINSTNSMDIASSLLDIGRAVTNLQTQIFGLEVISGEYKANMAIGHPLVPLIDSFLVPFDRAFEEKNIRVINGPENRAQYQNTVYLDYSLMNWAFYHLLSNAEKYCLKGTDLIILSSSQNRSVTLDMTSVRVGQEEVENIFLQNTRGKYAEEFPGDGLGMYFARMGLENMGATIKFIPGAPIPNSSEEENEYARNRIEISLK